MVHIVLRAVFQHQPVIMSNRSFGGGIARASPCFLVRHPFQKSPSVGLIFNGLLVFALFSLAKALLVWVHHRSVSVKHPSRTSTLPDVIIMCVLVIIAFCSSNISCAGPHQQNLICSFKICLFGQNHQQKHYFHIITLFLCPKKTSTNITPFGHGSKCLEVAWRRPR